MDNRRSKLKLSNNSNISNMVRSVHHELQVAVSLYTNKISKSISLIQSLWAIYDKLPFRLYTPTQFRSEIKENIGILDLINTHYIF